MQYTTFFSKNFPNYFDEEYVTLELLEFTRLHHTKNQVFLIEQQMLDERPFSLNKKCWTKSPILCCSLILEQFKQDVKNFN